MGKNRSSFFIYYFFIILCYKVDNNKYGRKLAKSPIYQVKLSGQILLQKWPDCPLFWPLTFSNQSQTKRIHLKNYTTATFLAGAATFDFTFGHPIMTTFRANMRSFDAKSPLCVDRKEGSSKEITLPFRPDRTYDSSNHREYDRSQRCFSYPFCH